jgi:glycine oxidase
LARAAADLGAIIREGAAIDRLLIEGDRIAGVAIADEPIHADQVVIANGSWAAGWSSTLELPIPIRPMRGQLLALRTAATPLRTVVAAGDRYALTKPDGSTIVGTTVEDVGFDSRPTAAGIASLLTLAPQLAPRLADATFVGAWAGLRPGTADGMPLIGRLPGWRGVILAGGHFRNGILLAPITGEVVTDLVARRRPRVSLEAFDPARFVVRAA